VKRAVAIATMLLAMGVACDVDQTEPAPASAPSAQPEPRPKPAQKRGAWAVALNHDCVQCHADQAQAWHSSRHHRSNTNREYREAFAREPSVFCTSCHAPEAADPSQPTPEESALGVGCVSCHVVGDSRDYTILSGVGSRAAPPHPVTRSLDFATTGGCVGCHEFRFPGRTGDSPEAFMQTTVRELHAAAGPEASCLSCHMPAGSHAFDRSRDPVWLAEHLEVDARATETGGVLLVLSQPLPSHAFPTGDLFRRLQIGVEWLDDAGAVIERQTSYLARHFELADGTHHGRTLLADNRVHMGPHELPFERDGDGPAAATLRWWVTLQRVGTVGRGVDPENGVTIDSEQLVHRGSL
jgi:Cytochrome c554 and c-prime